MVDRDLRRALAFIVPYWRRLALVMVAEPRQHGRLALPAAPLPRLLRRRAARPRRRAPRPHRRAVRADLDRQLRAERRQRPALHARVGGHPVRHAPGDVPPSAAAVAALLRAHAAGRHHVAHQQRHRRDPADRGRDRAGLVRQRAVPRRHGRHADLARLAAVPGQRRDRAARRLGAGALPRAARGSDSACCASAAPTSAAS